MADTFNGVSRRELLRLGALGAVAGVVGIPAEAAEPAGAATMINVPYKAMPDGPRIGMIGVGGRGTNLLENLLGANARVLAICDVVKEKASHAQGLVEKSG